MIKSKHIAVLTLSSLMLGSCLSLLPEAANAPSIYRMDINPDRPNVEKTDAAPVVVLPKPLASRALSGDEIVLSPDGRRIAYAAGSRWVEPVPSLVQNAFLDGFAQIPELVGIPTGTAVRGDYSLQVHIQQFEAVFHEGEKSAPTARIRMTMTLTDIKDRTLAGQTEISVSRLSPSRGVGDITATQTQLTRQAVNEARDWVLSRVKS